MARTNVACCLSEWAMLASSTGIASSISCSVACTEVVLLKKAAPVQIRAV